MSQDDLDAQMAAHLAEQDATIDESEDQVEPLLSGCHEPDHPNSSSNAQASQGPEAMQVDDDNLHQDQTHANHPHQDLHQDSHGSHPASQPDNDNAAETEHEAEPETAPAAKPAGPARRIPLVKRAQAMAAAPQPAPTTNKPAAPRKKFGLPTSVPKNPETSSNPEKGSTNAEGSAEPSKPVTKPASKPTIPNLTKPALTNKAAALVKPAAPTAKVVLKPAAAKAGPSKGAAVGEDGDDGAGPSGDGADVKKPKSAYIFFSADYRAVIKEENPEASFGEIGKLLGERYKTISDEEKAAYQAKADEDKERYLREVEAVGGVKHKNKPKAKGKQAGDKKPKVARVKSIYELFCQDRRADLKKDNPKAGSPEIDALLKTEWAALSDEDKAPYLAKREQLKEEAVQLAAEFAAQQAANSDCDGNDAPAAPAKGKKRANAGAKPQGGAKKAKKAQGGDDEDAETAPMKTTARSAAAVAAAAEEDEDEDRENVDWEAHPAVAILSKTRTGKYIVARQGLPLHDYGEVSVAAANQRRSGLTSGDALPCPLDPSLVEEFENYGRTFKREVFDNTDDGELDLEGIQPGSLLEACAFLGAMRTTGYELSTVDKKSDVWMKVPMMATSRLVQRMVEVKSAAKTAALQAEVEALKQKIALLEVSASGQGKGGDVRHVDAEAAEAAEA